MLKEQCQSVILHGNKGRGIYCNWAIKSKFYGPQKSLFDIGGHKKFRLVCHP